MNHITMRGTVLSRGTVLVVDDDQDVANILQEVLEEGRYNVACAEDAAGALARLDRHPPDVVLLDCHLPKGGMSEILARADETGASVVLMSGNPEILAQLAAFGYPCLYKPFRLADLAAALDTALRRL